MEHSWKQNPILALSLTRVVFSFFTFQFEVIDLRYYLPLPAASLRVLPFPPVCKPAVTGMAPARRYLESTLLHFVSVSECGYRCVRLGHQKVIAGI